MSESTQGQGKPVFIHFHKVTEVTTFWNTACLCIYWLFAVSTSRCHPQHLYDTHTLTLTAVPHCLTPPLYLTGTVAAMIPSSPLLWSCTMCGQPWWKEILWWWRARLWPEEVLWYWLHNIPKNIRIHGSVALENDVRAWKLMEKLICLLAMCLFLQWSRSRSRNASPVRSRSLSPTRSLVSLYNIWQRKQTHRQIGDIWGFAQILITFRFISNSDELLFSLNMHAHPWP